MNELEHIRRLLTYVYATSYNIADIHDLDAGFARFGDEYTRNFLFKKYRNLMSDQEVRKLMDKAAEDAEYAIHFLKFHNINVLTYRSELYPEGLRALKDHPPLIYYRGNLTKIPLAAIVGTRQVSTYGTTATQLATKIFADNQYGIVSGLALGIDSIAHKAAVDAGIYTLAVLPNCLDSVYPKANVSLANKILDEGGAIMSELIFGINRGKKSFVERNRLQSALSKIVHPVEMSRNSGTMHTIRYALSMQKDLILVKPENHLNELVQYEGINYLLAEYKRSPRLNIHIINNLSELQEKIEYIKSSPTSNQMSMF